MTHCKVMHGLMLASLLGIGAGCIDRPSPASTSDPRRGENASGKNTSAAVANEPAAETDPAAQQPASTADSPPASAQSDAAAKKAAPRITPVAAPRPGRLRSISFDDIKFEMEKDAKFERSMLTPAIENLNGARIRIRGWILPSFRNEGITRFVLVRDNMECCFGPGAALYDCIAVTMSPGQSIEYTSQMVAVEGVFEIKEWVDEIEGRHLAIYHLTADKVR